MVRQKTASEARQAAAEIITILVKLASGKKVDAKEWQKYWNMLMVLIANTGNLLFFQSVWEKLRLALATQGITIPSFSFMGIVGGLFKYINPLNLIKRKKPIMVEDPLVLEPETDPLLFPDKEINWQRIAEYFASFFYPENIRVTIIGISLISLLLKFTGVFNPSTPAGSAAKKTMEFGENILNPFFKAIEKNSEHWMKLIYHLIAGKDKYVDKALKISEQALQTCLGENRRLVEELFTCHNDLDVYKKLYTPPQSTFLNEHIKNAGHDNSQTTRNMGFFEYCFYAMGQSHGEF
jgi:hypothetical protein